MVFSVGSLSVSWKIPTSIVISWDFLSPEPFFALSKNPILPRPLRLKKVTGEKDIE